LGKSLKNGGGGLIGHTSHKKQLLFVRGTYENERGAQKGVRKKLVHCVGFGPGHGFSRGGCGLEKALESCRKGHQKRRCVMVSLSSRNWYYPSEGG